MIPDPRVPRTVSRCLPTLPAALRPGDTIVLGTDGMQQTLSNRYPRPVVPTGPVPAARSSRYRFSRWLRAARAARR